MLKNCTDRCILFFLTDTTYKPVKINSGGKQLQLMFNSRWWLWKQSGTVTCTQRLENGYPSQSKDAGAGAATGKSCSWGVWETTFDDNCCSSTCLDNTENTLQLTKGKCHTFIQTTCFFFYSVKMSGWLHKMESAIRLSSGVSASSLQMICRHCCSSLTRWQCSE